VPPSDAGGYHSRRMRSKEAKRGVGAAGLSATLAQSIVTATLGVDVKVVGGVVTGAAASVAV